MIIPFAVSINQLLIECVANLLHIRNAKLFLHGADLENPTSLSHLREALGFVPACIPSVPVMWMWAGFGGRLYTDFYR